MTTVQIGSVSIADQAASGFIFTKLTDWYTLPGSKTPIRPRPLGADGAFGIDQDWRDSAAVSVEGWYLGADRVSCLAAKRALTSLGIGGMKTITVTDEEGPSSRSVSVRDVNLPDDNGKTAFQFTIDMIAPDPRRYGATQTVSTGLPTAGTGMVLPVVFPVDFGSGGDPGRATATNTGTAPMSPLLFVTGGLGAGVELVEINTGSYLRLDRVIPLGGTVYFDTRTARVYLDTPANDITGFVTRKDWAGFQIPGGGTRTVQFNGLGTVTGTPLLTIQYSRAD